MKIAEIDREKLIASIRKNRFEDFDKLSSISSPKQYLVYFIKCFDLLRKCIQDTSKTPELSRSLEQYKNTLQKLYDRVLKLSFKFDATFGGYSTNKEIEHLFLQNKDDIVGIVSFIYPLGTITRTYDPDKHSGVY